MFECAIYCVHNKRLCNVDQHFSMYFLPRFPPKIYVKICLWIPTYLSLTPGPGCFSNVNVLMRYTVKTYFFQPQVLLLF